MKYKNIEITRIEDGKYLSYEFTLKREDYVESMLIGENKDYQAIDTMLLDACKSIIDNGGY